MTRPRAFVRQVLVSGNVAGLASALAAALLGRIERGRAAAPVAAISHIHSGKSPQEHANGSPRHVAAGFVIHQGACVFWAVLFEALLGRSARPAARRPMLAGAAIASAAYLTDYHLVPPRLRPGFEATLSRRSTLLVYAALGIAFAAAGVMRASRPSSRRWQ